MTPLFYRKFRPTSKYIGLVWLGRTIIGIEVTPDALGIVIWDMWMGVVKMNKDKFAELPKGDTNKRQAKRQQQLETMARLAGWDSWSKFVTAAKNGVVMIPRKPEEKS